MRLLAFSANTQPDCLLFNNSNQRSTDAYQYMCTHASRSIFHFTVNTDYCANKYCYKQPERNVPYGQQLTELWKTS